MESSSSPMRIDIRFIDHQQQRYETIGDWQFLRDAEGERLLITISKLGDWRYDCLVAIHELIEVLLCKYNGVSQDAVDAFDIAYEANRPSGDLSEPGDSPDAPYRREHSIASGVERVLAAEFGVQWKHYGDAVDNMPDHHSSKKPVANSSESKEG